MMKIIEKEKNRKSSENLYKEILASKKQFHFGKDFNPDKELERAIDEKYGYIDKNRIKL